MQRVTCIEQSLGEINKKVTKSEFKNIKYVRKSIVANQNIKKGEFFTIKNLCASVRCICDKKLKMI